MPILAALTIIVLLFCGSTFSEISYPNCTSAGFSWAYNSLNQSPCGVVAYLAATCNNGAWVMGPLPTGNYYLGPNDNSKTNLCLCNSVLYSLISACDACQGDSWSTWSQWAYNCTQTSPPSTFPNPIPDGTRVPHWALLDITIENNWNPNKSRTAGDSPEISPGVLITASSSSAPTTTGTSQDSTATGASSPNTGLIIAGAVGGVTGIAVIIIAVVVIFFLQRRRARASSDVVAAITEDTAPFAVGSGAQPRNRGNNALSDDVIPEPPTALMGVYNPNNVATLPEPQDPNAPHLSVQALLEQYQATGNTLPNMNVSQQQGNRNIPGI